MSRAFTPPDTLSPSDVRTVADVRRTVWINGIFGLGAGATTCALGHVVLQKLQSYYLPEGNELPKQLNMIQKFLKPLPPLGRNTFTLSLLGGGALGSFVMSTSAGREEHAGQSPYQIALNKSKQQSNESQPQHVSNPEEDELDAAHHRQRSIQRRASIKERLENGHSLSSTHAKWPELESEDTLKEKGAVRAEQWEKRQTKRREWVNGRIERGRALSDATGGNWDEKQ
eukprot:scaffold1306_cov73-Cyclotella_meneghiniana.AAC.4